MASSKKEGGRKVITKSYSVTFCKENLAVVRVRVEKQIQILISTCGVSALLETETS